MDTIRSNYKLIPYAEAYEPSSIDIDIDELREHRDIQIDELKDRYERAHLDKVSALIYCIHLQSIIVPAHMYI